MIDPGDEPDRLLAAVDALGVSVEAILLTHTHFDHIGAVAPVARATGAPVWCPELEVPVLADIMRYVPWPGFGPFESYEADHTVAGGETLQLAGLEIEVLFTPGHSPGPCHLPRRGRAGDVLRRRAVRRVDRPHRPPRRRHRDADAHARRRCSTCCPTRPPCIPATWARRPSAASAPRTRSSPSGHEPDASRRRAARSTCWASRPSRANGSKRTPARILERAGYEPHRDARPSRRRSCSPAGWGSRRTSCRRRCTRSPTTATSPTRCARRAPRRSAAPISSTACTSCRSR